MSLLVLCQLLFWLSCGFVVYTYFLYPGLISLWAALVPRPVRGQPITPSISVVIAAHNEAATIGSKIDNLFHLDYPEDRLQVVIVSDGSSDRTDDIVRAAMEGNRRLRLLRIEPWQGKPSCLNRGVAEASGEILVLADARQRLDAGALRALAAPFADPEVGVVGGELEIEGSGGPGLYWRYERAIRRAEGRVHSTLGASGALYAIRRSLWTTLPEDTILDDMLAPLRAHLAGYRVVYEGQARFFDRVANTQDEFRRKLRTLTGNFQLLARLPALLHPLRNPTFAQFVSHKLFRLLVPYALVAALLGNLLLAWPLAGSLAAPFARGLYRLFFALQAVLYLGAALGAATRAGGVLGVMHTFVALNAAAVVGLWRFLAARQSVRWKGE